MLTGSKDVNRVDPRGFFVSLVILDKNLHTIKVSIGKRYVSNDHFPNLQSKIEQIET